MVGSRDGNRSDLDRVQVDPDPDPFSDHGSRSDPDPSGLKKLDPDPQTGPKLIWIQINFNILTNNTYFNKFKSILTYIILTY